MYKRILSILTILTLAVALQAQDEGVTCGPKFKATDQASFEKAKSLYESKRYKESREIFHKLSSKYPSAPDPYFYLGMIAVKKDFNAAGIRRYFPKAVTLCPSYPNALAHYYKSIVDYTDENYDEAVASLNRYFDITNQSRLAEYEAVYEEASNYLYWSQFLAEANKAKVPFRPFVVTGVSSKYNEYLPYLTPDGESFYFLRQVSEGHSATFYKRELETKIWRLYRSDRRDTSYSNGIELSAPFNTSENEGSMSMTADNRVMYYSRMVMKNGSLNCDIFCTTFANGRWSGFESAGSNVNSDKTWESQPSVTADGEYLYFASNREGGMGGTDIWRCHRLPNGDWSRAENMGPSINTPGNEKCPFIHADGKTLYFASEGWQGFGGYDMYFINVNDTYLQRPTNMGLPINSEADEICFGVTTDGQRGYYASKPPEGLAGNGGTDVFMFDLYPSAQPEPMRLCKVRVVTSEAKPVASDVSVCRKGANRMRYASDKASGECPVMLSMKVDNFVVATAKDCVPAVRVFKASAVKQQPENPVYELQIRPLKKDGRYPLPGIQFSAKDLTDASKTILDAYIDFLRENPMVHIRIEGVTENMVRAVYDYMIAQKLRPERLSYKAGGSADLQFVVVQK